jgi:hypothetical protein
MSSCLHNRLRIDCRNCVFGRAGFQWPGSLHSRGSKLSHDHGRKRLDANTPGAEEDDRCAQGRTKAR